MKKKQQIKHLICLCLFVIAAGIMQSCGASKGAMERGIKESFQERMNTDSAYSKYGIQV
jgi:hypothetical protein